MSLTYLSMSSEILDSGSHEIENLIQYQEGGSVYRVQRRSIRIDRGAVIYRTVQVLVHLQRFN